MMKIRKASTLAKMKREDLVRLAAEQQVRITELEYQECLGGCPDFFDEFEARIDIAKKTQQEARRLVHARYGKPRLP
jgi:hypothetical protein